MTEEQEIPSNLGIVGYPRVVDDIGVFQDYLANLRMTDAKHDFGNTINEKYIKKTIPLNSEKISGSSEDKFYNQYVNESEYVKSKYYTHKVNVDESPSNSSGKYEGQTKTGVSAIEDILKKHIQEGTQDKPVDIFLHVDTSYKGLKRDVSYFEKYRLFWVNSKTQMYDPADKTHPGTDVGKNICGWGNPENRNLFYAWEDTSPGIKQNLFYPKWERGEYKVLESYVFTPYNIFMQTTNDKDPNDYMKHESNVVIYDPTSKKYIYADKTLSNKNGTNVKTYAKLIKDKFSSISDLLRSYIPQGQKPAENDQLPFDDSSLVISKFMGDASQYLFAGLSGIHYRYRENSDLKTGTVKKVVSGRYNAFVSFDRVAIVGAINAGVPIVIHDKKHEFDVFILKEIENIPKNIDDINRLHIDKLLEKVNKQIEIVEKLITIFDGILNEYNTYKDYYKIIKGNTKRYFEELIISNDDSYKKFIKLIVFLLVPLNLSSNITIIDSPNDVKTKMEAILDMCKTIKIGIEDYKKDINGKDQSTVTNYIDAQDKLLDNVMYEDIEGKPKLITTSHDLITTTERLKQIYEYFTPYTSSIYVNSQIQPSGIFNGVYYPNANHLFKSITGLVNANPFSNANSRGSDRGDTLLPKAVRLFMTNHLVDFIHSLDSDLGKDLKPKLKKVLDTLFSNIFTKSNDYFKSILTKHTAYLNEATTLNISLPSERQMDVVGGDIDNLHEDERDLLKAITLIYISIHNFIRYNKHNCSIIVKYSNGRIAGANNSQMVNEGWGRRGNQGFPTDDQIYRNMTKVNDEHSIHSERNELIKKRKRSLSRNWIPDETPDGNNFDLYIVTFPIDMVLNYLDENVTASSVNAVTNKINGSHENTSGGGRPIKPHLLELYDALSLPPEYHDDYDAANKQLTIYIDDSFEGIFNYLDEYQATSDSSSPMGIENIEPILLSKLDEHKLKKQRSAYDLRNYQLPNSRRLAKLDVKNGEYHSSLLRSSSVSQLNGKSHRVNTIKKPAVVRGAWGGKQTKKKRTTHEKNPNKSCNQKRTKRFIKQKKYQTLKKQRRPNL